MLACCETVCRVVAIVCNKLVNDVNDCCRPINLAAGGQHVICLSQTLGFRLRWQWCSLVLPLLVTIEFMVGAH